jgi:hypothetical protein
MSVVALVIAPSLVNADDLAVYSSDEVRNEVTVDVRSTITGDISKTYIVVRTISELNGVQVVEEVKYEGNSTEEVMDEVKKNHPDIELNVAKSNTVAVPL